MDKKFGLILYQRQICLLIIIASGICCAPAAKPDALKIEEINRIWQSIPVYPGMMETTENTVPTDSPLVITKTYKSDASFEDVQKFYAERMITAGWQLIVEEEIKDRGRIRGEQILEFTKDGYRLTVEFAGQLKADLGWDYAIELSPADYWKEKID
ncbi:MAG TPA: hypothetical protein VF692_05480 [Pyrinomonadaceae bacterium]|jgi:hypothetical protein